MKTAETFFKKMYFNIWQGHDLSKFDKFYAKNFEETIMVSDENKQPTTLRMNYEELLSAAIQQKENYKNTTIEVIKCISGEDNCICVNFYSSSLDVHTGELRHRSVCGIWHLNANHQIDRVWAVVTPHYFKTASAG